MARGNLGLKSMRSSDLQSSPAEEVDSPQIQCALSLDNCFRASRNALLFSSDLMSACFQVVSSSPGNIESESSVESRLSSGIQFQLDPEEKYESGSVDKMNPG